MAEFTCVPSSTLDRWPTGDTQSNVKENVNNIRLLLRSGGVRQASRRLCLWAGGNPPQGVNMKRRGRGYGYDCRPLTAERRGNVLAAIVRYSQWHEGRGQEISLVYNHKSPSISMAVGALNSSITDRSKIEARRENSAKSENTCLPRIPVNDLNIGPKGTKGTNVQVSGMTISLPGLGISFPFAREPDKIFGICEGSTVRRRINHPNSSESDLRSSDRHGYKLFSNHSGVPARKLNHHENDSEDSSG
ncbi:hypothetical protein DFH11DRAFT_1544235 [Phellopilus nigrolimitatus]|nr:hypothetical protein DFH11DRAFT_1544235 [Phellopilus nigrolimitatus]